MEKRLLFSKIQIYTPKREISLKNLDVLIANKKKKGKKKTMFKKKKYLEPINQILHMIQSSSSLISSGRNPGGYRFIMMKNKVRTAAPVLKNPRACPQSPAMLLRTMRKSPDLTFPTETGTCPLGIPLWAAKGTCPPVPCTAPTRGGHIPISQYCAVDTVGAVPAREILRNQLLYPSRGMGLGCLWDRSTRGVSPPVTQQ